MCFNKKLTCWLCKKGRNEVNYLHINVSNLLIIKNTKIMTQCKGPTEDR